ncbi:hypothetical protein HHL17_23255, partial [Chitinophaga sp. G-6-1-13]
RIRTVYQAGQAPDFVYDYFVKDHLGNTRLVLTEQTNLSMYAATMETPNAAKENLLFSNIDNTRSNKPVGYPADESAGKNESVAKLTATGTGKKIGPSLVLRVMAGDTIQLSSKAFYKSNGPVNKNSPAVPAENMVADLINAFAGTTSADVTHGSAAPVNNTPFNTNFYNNDYRQLKEKNPDQQPGKPKAYLNYVLFDDQFKMVNENSGVKQVKAEPDELQTLLQDKMVMKKSGFLYVYTSNESTQEVFFDNLLVAQASGPVLEETHYYPFGLTMAGISANALKGANYPENRKKYNGIEFTNELDLNIYDAQLRNLDPQIGRWNQIDPKIENMEMWSPYVSNYDNPIKYNDFLGDEPSGPGDPIKRVGLVTGREYTLTAPTGVGSALKFAAQYVGGVINEGVEAANRYVNPLVPAAELVAGKSYESGFSEDKSRVVSGVEVAVSLIPGGKAEMGAAKVAERSVVSLDNNALVHAIEGNSKDAVKAAIGNDKPIVSITAIKEFLVKGDKDALRSYMKEIGATVSTKGGSSSQVKALQQTAESMGRKVGTNDASIIAGATNNNATIISNDKQMVKFMRAIGLPVKNF